MTTWESIAGRAAKNARYSAEHHRVPEKPAGQTTAASLEIRAIIAAARNLPSADDPDDPHWWRRATAARWIPQRADPPRAGSGLEHGPIGNRGRPTDLRGPGRNGPAPAM
jgi:hypothetical protein